MLGRVGISAADELPVKSLREYDSVRIVHVSPDLGSHRVWEGSARPPQVGDVGSVIQLRQERLRAPRYLVECVTPDGRTLWMAEFDQTELELTSRP